MLWSELGQMLVADHCVPLFQIYASKVLWFYIFWYSRKRRKELCVLSSPTLCITRRRKSSRPGFFLAFLSKDLLKSKYYVFHHYHESNGGHDNRFSFIETETRDKTSCRHSDVVTVVHDVVLVKDVIGIYNISVKKDFCHANSLWQIWMDHYCGNSGLSGDAADLNGNGSRKVAVTLLAALQFIHI